MIKIDPLEHTLILSHGGTSHFRSRISMLGDPYDPAKIVYSSSICGPNVILKAVSSLLNRREMR